MEEGLSPYGWAISPMRDGTFTVTHSGGFYVMGFPTFAEAAVWLQHYLLADLDRQSRERIARDAILAQMEPYRGPTQ